MALFLQNAVLWRGLLNMEKIDPLYQKNVNILAKNRPFFSKSRTYGIHKKNKNFLNGIQNDDAYLLSVGVAGPGPKQTMCSRPGAEQLTSCLAGG